MNPTASAVRHHPHTVWEVLKTTVNEWISDGASQLAAAVAYYAIFAIGPLLIIAIAVVGMALGERAAHGELHDHLAQFFGGKVADSLQALLVKIHFSPSLTWAGLISLALLLYAAANLFTALQSALNTIFDVTPRPGRSILAILRDRAMSFLMVIGVGAVVLIAIVLNTTLAAFTHWGGAHLGDHPTLTAALMEVISFLLSCILFTGIFALLLKYLPDVKIRWRDTLLGAATTAILFTLARIGLSYYLSHTSTAGPFGAAGSLVIVMLFIYYSTQILFWGAEFTQVWACRHGHPIRPARNATWQGAKFRKRVRATAKSKNRQDTAKSRPHWWTGRQQPGWRIYRPKVITTNQEGA